jgi:hypothetical protein
LSRYFVPRLTTPGSCPVAQTNVGVHPDGRRLCTFHLSMVGGGSSTALPVSAADGAAVWLAGHAWLNLGCLVDQVGENLFLFLRPRVDWLVERRRVCPVPTTCRAGNNCDNNTRNRNDHKNCRKSILLATVGPTGVVPE